MRRCCTEAGTRATPSPAATKATRVEVSATSWDLTRREPGLLAGLQHDVVHHGPLVGRVADERVLAQVSSRTVSRGRAGATRAAARSAARCGSPARRCRRAGPVVAGRRCPGSGPGETRPGGGREHLPLQVQLDPRQDRAHDACQDGQQLVGGGAREADDKVPDLARGDAGRLLVGLPDGGKDLPGPVQVALAGGVSSTLRVERTSQLDPQVALELLDLLRQGGLCDVQPLRGPPRNAVLPRRRRSSASGGAP